MLKIVDASWRQLINKGRSTQPTDGLRRLSLQALGLLALLPSALVACSRKGVVGQRVPPVATVLALGDSLTAGTGATTAQAYPALLAQASGWRVVNAGVPGNLSAQALARLPELLAQHRPALVIVSIGGNDFLRRLPAQETKDNIRLICQQSQQGGAQVMLVAVPALDLLAAVGRLNDHALYAQVAEELQLPLLAGAWSAILSDAGLRSDQIHANALGYAQFAHKLEVALRQAGMLA